MIKRLAIATLLIPGLIQVGLAQPTLPAYVLTGVHVLHPADERVDRDQTVLVIGQKISFVGPSDKAEAPAGAMSIDARGAYLLPGLAEMHAHVPLASQGDQYLQDMLFLWVANGVTTLRGMRGEPSHLTLREQLTDGTVLGPRLITAGPALTGDAVDGPEDARQTAQAHVAAGYDFIKVHWRLSRAEYDAIAQVAQTAGVPFAGHVAEDVGLARALAAGQASIDHLDGYFPALLPEQGAPAGVGYGFMGESLTPYIDPTRVAAVAEATRSAGVWNAPTQSMVANFMRPLASASERPGLAYMPVAMTNRWQTTVTRLQSGDNYDADLARKFLELRRQLIKALHDAGAGLLLASDATQINNVPGFSLHEELAEMVAAGLTPAQAITTGTVNAAEFFGAADHFGRIAAGLDADLILADDNPFLDLGTLRKPRGVMVRGRWLDRRELQAGLDRIAARQAAKDTPPNP